MKTHLMAFIAGVLACVAAVIFLTNNDAGLQKLNTNKQIIKTEAAKLKEEHSQTKKKFTNEIIAIKKQTALNTNEASTKIEKLQKKNAGLRKQITVLNLHIKNKDALLKKHQKLNAESLAALNQATRALQIKHAREKSIKIGAGIGVPLMLIGGFVGGFYLAGIVK